MTAIILSVFTFFSTLAGGLFAMRYKSRLHAIMAFTAGVIMGVVCFDLLPEIFEQMEANKMKSTAPMVALVLGFLLFHILEKTLLIHHGHEETYAVHKHPNVGVLSALALCGHSFMDGMGIGLGFQVSNVVGALVALAVISHDFADGMNTVVLMLSHDSSPKKARLFLILDAVAPVLGATSTLLFTVSPQLLVLFLGFFAGFLLYIGASDILPEAHSQQPSYKLLALTILGVVFIFIVTRFA